VGYVLDDNGQRVVRALENPKYDWRTIDGISSETGIDRNQVALLLTFLQSTGEVVQSSVPDKRGRALFTTRNHYSSRRNVMNRILSVFSDRIK
jgi:hypothetical protein